jgi:hypothetical protein
MNLRRLCVILLQVKYYQYHKTAVIVLLCNFYSCNAFPVCSDFPREDTYEEDEGETGTYLSPEAYEGGYISKRYHKKKHQMYQRISGARQYEIGIDVPYEPCLESKSWNRTSNGKRSSFLVVPAKRSRTAARQQVVSLFPASVTAAPHVKTDASSGDTNSLQDDESSLHGGSMQWRNMDYESTVDFDRQLPYNSSEVSTKANKKKKLNILGYRTAQNTANSYAPASVKVNTLSFLCGPCFCCLQYFLSPDLFLFQSHMYDQRLQVEDYLKKRPEGHQYNSNRIYGNVILFVYIECKQTMSCWNQLLCTCSTLFGIQQISANCIAFICSFKWCTTCF